MEERWLQIEGFADLYEVSNLGRVRRSPIAPACRSSSPGRILNHDCSSGYARVSLNRDGKSEKRLVHRLVAKAFLGRLFPRQHVNHIDGNKLNNSAENLEWATPRENVLHAWRTGLSNPIRGQDHGMSKLTNDDIARVMDAASRGVTQRRIAEVFGVTEAAISAIVRGASWKHLTEARTQETA